MPLDCYIIYLVLKTHIVEERHYKEVQYFPKPLSFLCDCKCNDSACLWQTNHSTLLPGAFVCVCEEVKELTYTAFTFLSFHFPRSAVFFIVFYFQWQPCGLFCSVHLPYSLTGDSPCGTYCCKLLQIKELLGVYVFHFLLLISVN